MKKLEGYPRNIWQDSMGIQFNLFSKKVGGIYLGSFSTSSSKKLWDKLTEHTKITVTPIHTMKLPRDFEGVTYTRQKVKVTFR